LSLRYRIFRAIAQVSIRWPYLVLLCAVALSIASVFYTKARLEFRTGQDDLITPNSRASRDYLDYTREFPDLDGLIIVVRAAPDVILIGEIRDRESMEAAIHLAGTGHLVLATMHANNSAESLDRIINMFPREQHAQIFLDLSQYLRAILAQRLIMGKDNKRCAAVEVMLNTPHIQELVKKGDVVGIKEAISASGERGIQSFDVALRDLYKQNRINLEEALVNADSRANLEAKINFG